MLANLTEIYDVYRHFINDNLCVYKICLNKWFIILQKTNDTIDNEMRCNLYSKNDASYRANKLLVLKIFDVNNPKNTIDTINNNFLNSHVIYNVNQIVSSDKYNSDVNIVATYGIHYYKTIDRAYYSLFFPYNYNGYWIYYINDGSGKKICEGNINNGEQNGEWKYWVTHNQFVKYIYKNGEIYSK